MQRLVDIVLLAAGMAFMLSLLALLAGLLHLTRQLPGILRLFAIPIVMGGFAASMVWLGVWLDKPAPREHWMALHRYVAIGSAVGVAIQLVAILARALGV